MLTDGLNACKAGFQAVEDHENTLDKRISELEKRITHLEDFTSECCEGDKKQ